MNRKNKIWKFATVFVVAFIILNPEMLELAFFIDAVGLEIFLMLLEIQLLAILSAFIDTKIKPTFKNIKYSWSRIKTAPESLILVMPGPVFIMHMLVFSAAISLALNS